MLGLSYPLSKLVPLESVWAAFSKQSNELLPEMISLCGNLPKPEKFVQGCGVPTEGIEVLK
jgi:hypothetical protein